MDKKSFINKRIYQHLLFWFTFLIMIVLRYTDGYQRGFDEEVSSVLIIESSRFFTMLFIVYTNLRVLFPSFFKRGKYKYFFLLNFCQVLLGASISVFLTDMFFNKVFEANIYIRTFWNMIPPTMIITITSLLHITKEWINLREDIIKIKMKNNKKLYAELDSLKSQLNPHFFFNTLNNLYSLSLVKSDETPNVILKLSDLMSYIIYDTRVDFISIKKEIEFMKNFIDLEKLRLNEHLSINVKIICNNESREIAPLLFLPFIENAFKYTSRDPNTSFVNISILVEDNEPIRMSIINTIDNNIVENIDNKHSGLGIKNVIKRLNLIYPDSHKLDISQRKDLYIVNLEISDK
ncbi:histidine kinase [Marinilabiliaceae bacterium JC040]|nr:histidine kinase [Marinilabiliaceae bacterium JC040]